MLKTINAAVIETIVDDHLGAKTPITQHVVSFVPFENREEAHYFSSFMNSTIVSLVSIACFTGKGFGTPGLMDFIKIPKYQPENSHHKRLACLSIDAHRIKQKNNKNRLEKVQNCIDLTIAEILGYGTKELSDIQRSLEELS